jgi:hypothetical protein
MPPLKVFDASNHARVVLGDISAAEDESDFGLKVTSSDGTTVIIDGTSDIFKIVTSGTVSTAWPAAAPGVTFTDTALAAVIVSVTPVVEAWLSVDVSVQTGERQQGNLLAFISPAGTLDYRHRASAFILGATPAPVVIRHRIDCIASTLGAGTTAGLRYYVMQQVAL